MAKLKRAVAAQARMSAINMCNAVSNTCTQQQSSANNICMFVYVMLYVFCTTTHTITQYYTTLHTTIYMQYSAHMLANFAMLSLTPASVVPVWAAKIDTARLQARLDGITHYGAIASLQTVLTDL
eukprot:10167-Heterococcus_DN1.PRE.3